MNGKRKAIFIISLLILALSVGYIVYTLTGNARRGAVYEDLKDSAYQLTETPRYESPIDFDSLWEINSDIYAWLEIPGTDTSYPVVQSMTDDDYYLDHTIEGYEGYPGSIYTIRGNDRDFLDFNTVIYGHNMKDGSMFGDLSLYRDEDYLSEHRTVTIYTPSAQYDYKVFASVVYDDRLITSSFNNKEPKECQEFLDSLDDVSPSECVFTDDVKVTADDRIITLSTCIGDRPQNRFLVLAVLIPDRQRS